MSDLHLAAPAWGRVDPVLECLLHGQVLGRLVAAERVERFVASATAPGHADVRPIPAGIKIWASEVRCLREGHPMLIWRLTEPGQPNAADRQWMPGPENFADIRARVDNWLAAAGSALAKAGIHGLKGSGHRRAFTCPECKDVISGRWVTALPLAKWSVIAEGSTTREDAREVLSRRPPLSAPVPAKPQAEARALRVAPVSRPASIQTGDPDFIGPRPWAVWMSEARDADELAARLAAKDARAARLRAISGNPRYIGSPNGFRFQCSDCGGIFEDDNEGIHADSRCLERGPRSSGWR